MKKVSKINNYIFIGIFITILCIPTLLVFIKGSPKDILVNINKFNDYFPYKDNILEIYNFTRYKIFNTVKTDEVLVGKDGWLFPIKNDEDDILNTYIGSNLFTDDEINKIEQNITETSETMKRNGVDFSIVLIPNSFTVYDYNLPKNIKKQNNSTRLEQVRNLNSTNIVDLTEVLINNRNEYNLYNKTSFDWNELGAYYGYREILNRFNIPDLIEDNFSIIRKIDYSGELGHAIGLKNLLSESVVQVNLINQKSTISDKLDERSYISNNRNVDENKIFVYGDKSMQKMNKYMSESFSRVVSKSDFQIDLNLVKKEKPNKIILGITENQLNMLIGTKIIKEDTNSNENQPLITPVLLTKTMLDPNNIVLVGNATSGSDIIITGGEKEIYSSSEDGVFIAKVPLKEGINNLKVVSIRGKEISESLIITSQKDKSAAIKPVVVGSKGYLFLNEDIEDFIGANLFSENQLQDIKENLNERDLFIKSINPNAKLIVFVVPNKLSFYQELKPDEIIKSNNSRLEQLTQYLEEENQFDFINVTYALNEYKEIDDLYYKTDIHWNELGAFYGYKELEKYLIKYNSNIKALNLDMYDKKYVKEVGGDLSFYLGLKNNILKEREIRLVPKYISKSNFKKDPPMTWMGNLNKQFTTNVPNNSLPKAVIFRDSFATNMMPYLSEDFSSITYCEEWNFNFNKDIILKEKPDFVIYEILEKNLSELLNK